MFAGVSMINDYLYDCVVFRLDGVKFFQNTDRCRIVTHSAPYIILRRVCPYVRTYDQIDVSTATTQSSRLILYLYLSHIIIAILFNRYNIIIMMMMIRIISCFVAVCVMLLSCVVTNAFMIHRPIGGNNNIGNRLVQQQLNMVAVDTSDIKNGMTIELDGEPCKVLGFSIMKQARGAAKTTIKFKNLIRGSTIENTYRSGEKFETALIEKMDAQFTFQEGVGTMFMFGAD